MIAIIPYSKPFSGNLWIRLILKIFFKKNIYFLFSAGRACNYVEEVRNLETVSVVNLKSLLGQKNKDVFEKL